MNTLQLLLGILQIAATAAEPYVQGNETAETADKLAQALIAIVQKASLAHQQVTGQPIDLSLLQPIEPVE